MSVYEVDGLFYRKGTTGRRGAEDLGFNTCAKIINDDDFSTWSRTSIEECAKLLQDGRRWPIRMDVEGQAPNKFAWWWSKLVSHKYAHRSADDLTRDPYILMYAAAVRINRYDLINDTPIPWWLNTSSDVRQWRRALLQSSRELVKDRLEYYMSVGDQADFERKCKLWIEEN